MNYKKKDWVDAVLSDDMIRGILIGATIMFISIVVINAICRWI